MPYINLIQEQRLARRQGERRARLLFGTFLIVLLVAVGAFGYLFFEDQVARRHLASFRKKVAQIQPILDEIEQNQKLLAAMGPRLTTLEQAQESTQRWQRVLDHLSRYMPETMWLTNMKADDKDAAKPVGLGLTGLSPSQDDVGDLLLRLQACTDLKNVTLKYTTERIQGEGKGIEFNVDAEIVGTEEAPLKKIAAPKDNPS
jgi:Tfp pilus assembly protein PilN